MFPDHEDLPACKLCNNGPNFKRRSDRRKPLDEFESELHVCLCHFQKLRLISLHVCEGQEKLKSFPGIAIPHLPTDVILQGSLQNGF